MYRIGLLFLVVAVFPSPSRAQQTAPRVWTDRTGEFKVTATLEGVVDGQVQLRKGDGATVMVDISRLSAEDREFIESINSNSSDISRFENECYAEERKILFAEAIVDFYRNRLQRDYYSKQQLVFVNWRLEQLKKPNEEKAILVKGKFVTPAELAALRSGSDKQVDEWKRLVQLAGGEKKSTHFKQAQQAIQEARRNDPVSFRADFELGLANVFVVGDFSKARNHFQACVNRGREFLPVLDELDRINFANAINNLALLKVRANKLQEADRLWQEMLTVAQQSSAEVAHNIKRVVKFMEVSERDPDKSYLRFDQRTRISYLEVLGNLGVESSGHGGGSSTGWLYLPYFPDLATAKDNQGTDRQLEDKACIICDGLGQIKCANNKCKSGKVTKYRWETTHSPDGRWSNTNRVRYYEACKNCRGSGRTRCWGCSGGKQGF